MEHELHAVYVISVAAELAGVHPQTLQGLVIRLVVMQRPRRRGDANFWQKPLFNASHQGAHELAFFEPIFEVTCLVQLAIQPAFFKRLRVGT